MARVPPLITDVPSAEAPAAVYLLWHVHHSGDDEGFARHQATLTGDWTSDEEAGDDVKLLGVYSTRANAQARADTARLLPGFRDEPECFVVDGYQVDHDEWQSGYVSY